MRTARGLTGAPASCESSTSAAGHVARTVSQPHGMVVDIVLKQFWWTYLGTLVAGNGIDMKHGFNLPGGRNYTITRMLFLLIESFPGDVHTP